MECDASLMDGDSGIFGGVGAVPGSSYLNLLLCNFVSTLHSLIELLNILEYEL